MTIRGCPLLNLNPALVFSVMAVSGCTGSSLQHWTDNDQHLNDADMASLQVSYELCSSKSWNDAVRIADLHTGRVPFITAEDVALGTVAPGHWGRKGTWFLGRALARSTIIAMERPLAFERCMHEKSWRYRNQAFHASLLRP